MGVRLVRLVALRLVLPLACLAASVAGACAFDLPDVQQIPSEVVLSSDDGGEGGTVVVNSPCGADLAHDPFNCGECGHSCGALPCEQGKCMPTIVGAGLGAPQIVAVSGQSLYFTEHVPRDVLVRADLAAPGSYGVIANLPSQAVSLLVAGSTAFVGLNDGRIVAPPLDRDGGAPNFVNTGGQVSIAADSTLLYYASGNDLLFFCPLTSPCSSDQSALVGKVGHSVQGLVLANGKLFTVDKNSGIYRCDAAPAGCGGLSSSTVVVITKTSNLVAIAADSAHVYGSNDTGAIVRCPFDGCGDAGAAAFTQLPKSQAPVAMLASTGALYVATNDSVLALDAATGTAKTIGSGFASVSSIALDATYVYVSDTGAGALWRLPR